MQTTNLLHRMNLCVLWCTLCLAAALPATAGVTTYYGVTGSVWTNVPGNMKMDYDPVNQRFVVQYNYFTSPPQYGTIDLATKALAHYASTQGAYYETLLTVLPSSWGSYAQGTTLVAKGGGGEIYAIDPVGNVSTFTTGLPGLPSGTGPTFYTTVRWDSFGVANNDLFYAYEGTGDIVRLNSSGNVVWQTTLTDRNGFQTRPEAMIVLGSNPRWGPYQNSVLVGQNLPNAPMFVLDPANGNVLSQQTLSFGSPESFRIFPFTGGNWALYVSLFGDAIYQLTNLTSIPNLQPGDLFIAVEQYGGGQVWHVYWDTTTNSLASQLIADFNSPNAFLEDMVFAPATVIPEPSSAVLFLCGLAGVAIRRKKRC